MNLSPAEKANAFVKTASYFSLGHVVTEQPHPKTHNLSVLAKSDPTQAVQLLKQIDIDALTAFRRYLPRLRPLRREVVRTLHEGGRIYLCGCGSTGRLALYLEFLWRQIVGDDRVIAFMAGGDIALVHALEGFEDFPQYGAEHLLQLSFSENDLLIACTEGGETPYVIGATEKAAAVSRHAPFFLYCNPDDVLVSVERSKRVLENSGIRKINLAVGPMALAGSTRMQASTVLQLAVGIALFIAEEDAEREFSNFFAMFQHSDTAFMHPFIVKESDIYRNNDHITYRVRDYGITAFTDTTERAPTFSLVPFDNLNVRRPKHSLSYVALSETGSADTAWRHLLGRAPRSLNWLSINQKTGHDYLMSFDFSDNAIGKRQALLPETAHHLFTIRKNGAHLLWALDAVQHEIALPRLHPLFEHTFLKLCLNIHSTLVMGRLDRYRSNLMTYVSATNGKLIDRAARYVMWLLKNDANRDIPYEEVVHEIFKQQDHLKEDEPIVLKAYSALSQKWQTSDV